MDAVWNFKCNMIRSRSQPCNLAEMNAEPSLPYTRPYSITMDHREFLSDLSAGEEEHLRIRVISRYPNVSDQNLLGRPDARAFPVHPETELNECGRKRGTFIGCPTSNVVAQANLTMEINFNILRSLRSSDILTSCLHAFLQ
jgi:hypothetical protein